MCLCVCVPSRLCVGFSARKKQEGKKELASSSTYLSISQDLPKLEGTTLQFMQARTPSFGNLAAILGEHFLPSLFPLQTLQMQMQTQLQNVEAFKDHTCTHGKRTAPTQFLGKTQNPQIFTQKRQQHRIALWCLSTVWVSFRGPG